MHMPPPGADPRSWSPEPLHGGFLPLLAGLAPLLLPLGKALAIGGATALGAAATNKIIGKGMSQKYGPGYNHMNTHDQIMAAWAWPHDMTTPLGRIKGRQKMMKTHDLLTGQGVGQVLGKTFLTLKTILAKHGVGALRKLLNKASATDFSKIKDIVAMPVKDIGKMALETSKNIAKGPLKDMAKEFAQAAAAEAAEKASKAALAKANELLTKAEKQMAEPKLKPTAAAKTSGVEMEMTQTGLRPTKRKRTAAQAGLEGSGIPGQVAGILAGSGKRKRIPKSILKNIQ